MKKYVYIDNNLISSYLAQDNPLGLSENTILGEENIQSQSETNSTTDSNTKSQIGITAPFINYARSIDNEVKNIAQTLSISEGLKKEVTYKQHSINKLNDFLEISDNDSIQINDCFKFYDLDKLIDMTNFTMIENFDTLLKPNIIEEFEINTSTKNKKNIKKDAIKKKRTEMETGLSAIKLFKMFFPCPMYLETTDYIVPLNKDYLLYDTSLLPFLFSEETNVIGIEGPRLSNIFNSVHYDNLICNIQDSLNSVGETFFGNLNVDQNKKILIPITWYQD